MQETEYINVYGARVHNLKDIDAEIPRNSLTVITGLSGSGKSSLAFDTIFAEGQRRYIETFSAYARNFLGNLERPDVDKITGLSPVISIEQKTTNKNPRSTVGTTTEIYDYLRLLYARAGVAYSYLSGEEMVKYTEEQILGLILKDYKGKKIYLLAPLIRTRKGHYRELFEQIRKKGYLYVRVDGEVREITHGMKLDRYKNHDIEVVIDKLVVTEKDDRRLKQSVATAMRQGDGLLMILDAQTESIRHYSKRLMCPVTGLSYREPAPHNFSFNSPQGACPKCKGLGVVNQIDVDKVIPDCEQSIYEGAIAPLGKYKNAMIFWQIGALLEKYDATLKTPVKELPDDAIEEVLYGSDDRIKIKSSLIGTSSDYFVTYEGVVKYIQMLQEKDASATAQKWAEQFAKTTVCPECKGARLNKEALHFRIHDKNINELANMDISELYDWLMKVDVYLSDKQKKISVEILKEIRTRLKFLLDVGLDYLALNRSYAVNAKLFHDFHNHIGVLRRMLSHQKTEEAVRYLDELQAPVQEMTDTVWTGDETLDYLINSKAAAAREKGILYEAEVEFPRHTNLQSADLCAILGNLLDNALEAACQVQESQRRFVRLTIRRINQMVIVKVENSFASVPTEKDGVLETSKNREGLHGWGLKSARAAAGKYDGIVRTSYTETAFTAVATLSYQGVSAQ